jgi:hypothetical protein
MLLSDSEGDQRAVNGACLIGDSKLPHTVDGCIGNAGFEERDKVDRLRMFSVSLFVMIPVPGKGFSGFSSLGFDGSAYTYSIINRFVD